MRRAPVAASEEARTAFQRYQCELTHRGAASVAILGGVLIPFFLVLDAVTMPREVLGRFAVYRGVVTGLIFLQWLVLKRTSPSRWSFVHGYFLTFVAGLMISWMTVDLGGFDSRYYAGLMLVVVAVNLLLPWRPLHSAANGFITVGMYVLLGAVFGGRFDAAALTGNLFFLCSLVVIAVASTSLRHDLLEREFYLRAELVQANGSLDRSRQELKEARDALWGEMELATRIQTALLPRGQRAAGYEVAARMRPAAEVGGDYYDIIHTPGGRSWVAVGDVSGHGVESGLVMMMTQTSIISVLRERPDYGPAQAFAAVNAALWENLSRLGTARYMTLNLVRLDPGGLTVAGKHQDVLVWRRCQRRVEVVTNQGPWIGLVPDVAGAVEDLQVPMAAGDVTLFFTDGASEATDAAGRMFGVERLGQALARVAERPLAEALERLIAEVAAFQARQDDDITLVLLRAEPDGRAEDS
ncbi:MAG TPA: SpoIIE family protein phosphatase [Anaeromyxobacteraceae bacterium]|nr:SpoIIE family protein phosphatase [Anaeromyxobacteraceae bacterium]